MSSTNSTWILQNWRRCRSRHLILPKPRRSETTVGGVMGLVDENGNEDGMFDACHLSWFLEHMMLV